MKKDLSIKPIQLSSSFLSCEKDCETILRKLFVESQPYSDILKRLLVINTKDCLDNTTNAFYKEKINKATLPWLRDNGYIRLQPKVARPEHEQVKAYLLITFDNFLPDASNPEYRDCTVTFDILCHSDYWDIGDYRLRPLKIAGYIDGILNKARLSGIGTFQFMGCAEMVLDQTLSGYSLIFTATHGNEDGVLPIEVDAARRMS